MTDELQNMGRDLVLTFASALRTVQTHGTENDAARAMLDRFASTLDAHMVVLGAVQLDVVDGMLLLNGTRLRPNSAQLPQFTALANELTSRGVGGVIFRQRLDVSTLRAFCALFHHRPENHEQLLAVQDYIFRHAPEGIVPLEPKTMTTADAGEVVRGSTMAYAVRAYASAVLAFREFVAALKAGRSPYSNRLNIVRVVQDVIDAAYSRADLLLFAVQIEKARGASGGFSYLDVHAANTCVYSVLLGRMLDLERTTLLDLGTSALLAGVGAALVLSDNSGVLTPEQRVQLHWETTRAVKMMLGDDQGNDDAVLMRTIVAYEHQRPIAPPPGSRERPLHVVSRIVSVASAYDAMTSDRPWRAAMPMQDALYTLVGESGTKFDPLVVGILGSLLSTYFSPAQEGAA